MKRVDFYQADITPKINLGLHIINKRSDGYHNLQTCFYRLPLTPELNYFDSISIKRVGEDEKTQIEIKGIEIEGNLENNLCYRAWDLCRKYWGAIIPNLHIHLIKRIPTGSGLGGGSANAAAVLDAINEIAAPPDWQNVAPQIALKLGADVSFFLNNNHQPRICIDNIGNELSPFELQDEFYSNYNIVVKIPDVHSSTILAYQGLNLDMIPKERKPLSELLRLPIKEWKENIFNDFEPSVFNKLPQIQLLKNQMINDGAIYASMSGSGSAVWGIFEK